MNMVAAPSKCKACPAAVLYSYAQQRRRLPAYLCFYKAYYLGKAEKADTCANMAPRCPLEAREAKRQADYDAALETQEARGIRNKPATGHMAQGDKDQNLVGLYYVTCQEIIDNFSEGAWDWIQEQDKPRAKKINLAKAAITSSWENRTNNKVTVPGFLAAVNFFKQLVMQGVDLYEKRISVPEPPEAPQGNNVYPEGNGGKETDRKNQA